MAAMKSGQSGEGDGLGPDGSVYLHRYLRHANQHWFSAGCRCGAIRPIGVQAAIAAAGPNATVLELARRLRCRACGRRRVQISIGSDTRPPELRKAQGPAPETLAGLGSQPEPEQPPVDGGGNG